MNINDLRTTLEQRRGQENQIEQDLQASKKRLDSLEEDLENHELAREVIKETGLKTQQALAFHISDISTMALQSVFEDPYDLNVNFVERRNKTECDLLFEKNGEEMDPLLASGGGAVDVAAFALRVASWSMQRPRSRPVIILDEPMKHLSNGLQPKASDMLKELSERLGIQFIIVTHEEKLTAQADKVFEVSQSKGITEVQ